MTILYRETRARLRDYHSGVLDSIDGMHRDLLHGDLDAARRRADDLHVLADAIVRAIEIMTAQVRIVGQTHADA